MKQDREEIYQIYPSQDAVNAFWKSWEENGETHKHGYYESTWMAVHAYIKVSERERDNQ